MSTILRTTGTVDLFTMMEEVEENSSEYLTIIAALKTRKAKLKEADSQAKAQIKEMEEELSQLKACNKSQGYCNCDDEEELDVEQEDNTSLNLCMEDNRGAARTRCFRLEYEQKVDDIVAPILERYL